MSSKNDYNLKINEKNNNNCNNTQTKLVFQGTTTKSPTLLSKKNKTCNLAEFFVWIEIGCWSGNCVYQIAFLKRCLHHSKNMDPHLKKSLSGIQLLSIRAGPRDADQWKNRCKQELQSLIKYVKSNKEQDKDWFTIK